MILPPISPHSHCLIMRVALITGAAQGIGQAIAQRLEKDGFSIAVNDLPSKQVELQSGFPSALVVVGDVSSEKDVQGMIAMVVEELGGLDVVSSYSPTTNMFKNAFLFSLWLMLVSGLQSRFYPVRRADSRNSLIIPRH